MFDFSKKTKPFVLTTKVAPTGSSANVAMENAQEDGNEDAKAASYDNDSFKQDDDSKV